jgi:hypothetical protein
LKDYIERTSFRLRLTGRDDPDAQLRAHTPKLLQRRFSTRPLFGTTSTFVMWRRHLDVPQLDLILDSSIWHLLGGSADPPCYLSLHRRACEEIYSVLHD